MKGFAAQHLLSEMREVMGAGAPAEFAQALDEPLRRFIIDGDVLAIAWVPVELYFSGVRRLAQHLGGPLTESAAEVGRRIARRDIGAFFKMVLSFTSPATVMTMSGRFWRTYFDVGALTLKEKHQGWVRAVVESWPLPSDEVSLYELGGSFVEWLSASRAADPRLESVTVKGSDVEYVLRWR